jgi:hypothetical protein
MNYKALMRRKLLEEIYDKMSDEEKRLYVQMTMQDRDHREIMQALNNYGEQIYDLRKHQQTFLEDFASNVAGNALWSGITWLGSKLLKLK